MTTKAPLGVLFAGGGTGGHVFPAIGVLESLREIEPDVRAHVLCSRRDIDERILNAVQPDLDLSYQALPAAPLILKPIGLTKFIWHWGASVRESRQAIRALRDRCERVRVFATGGFVAAPVAQAARVERVGLTLLNQDAPPGKANRWIARRASTVFTSADVDRAEWVRIPPVVRRAGVAPTDPAACRRDLGLDPDRPTLFITGASQGARSVNAFVAAFASAHALPMREGRWQVIHQTGSADNGLWIDAWAEAQIPARVEPFFDAMGLCWGSADLAVSRAGAGSVAEVWANRVPTLFLPYPYHHDQHQRFNAEPLESAGGVVIETDRIDAQANLTHAGSTLLGLMQDRGKREGMRDAFDALGPVNGASAIAQELVGNGP